jgi:hypothetical protein
MKKIAEFATFMGKSELEMVIELHELKVPMDLKAGEFDERSLVISLNKPESNTPTPIHIPPPVLIQNPTPAPAPAPILIVPPAKSTFDTTPVRTHNTVVPPKKRMMDGRERAKAIEELGDIMLANGVYLELVNPRKLKFCDCFVYTNTHREKIPAVFFLYDYV